MHLLFLDESGRLDQGGLFALGGIAVRDTDWGRLKASWQQTLAAHGWPLEKELKWHGIRKGEVPPALADAIYVALASAPFTAYVVVMDLDRGPSEFPDFFRTSEDVYANALMFAAERFHHLLATEDDVGAIVVDSRLREDDQRLRRFFADLTAEGTPYMRLERIVEGLFLTPSQYSRGSSAPTSSSQRRSQRSVGSARGADTSRGCVRGLPCIPRRASSKASESSVFPSRSHAGGCSVGCSELEPDRLRPSRLVLAARGDHAIRLRWPTT